MRKQLTPERRAARAVAREAAERQREQSVRTRPRWFNPWVGGILALVLAVVPVAVVLTSSGSDYQAARRTTQRAAAQAWRDAVLVDLRPLTGNAVQLGRTVVDWQAGRVTDAAAARSLSVSAARLAEAVTAVDKHAPLGSAPRAVEDFRLTARLYAAAVEVARTATTVPEGALRGQLQLQFSRLRDLGDRWFDQAGVELEPVLGAPKQVEGVEIRRTADVPDWSSNGLAAGPPLDVTGTSTTLREYQQTRPDEPFDAWRDDVKAAAVPPRADETAALAALSARTLADLARRFVAASSALHDSPDPHGERAVSTRLQLGLLVQAEAMRAAQAATLLSGAARAALVAAATDLASLADGTWDTRLGAR